MKTRFFSLLFFLTATIVTPGFAADGPGYSGLIPGKTPPQTHAHPQPKAKNLPPKGFRNPKTESETALNKLLLSGNSVLAPTEDDAFTKPLLNTVKEKEKKQKGGNCPWAKGGDCGGFNYEPMLCAQGSSPAGYFFRTVNEDKHRAIIESRWQQTPGVSVEDPIKRSYKLVKQGKEWKLDGITCGTERFNM